MLNAFDTSISYFVKIAYKPNYSILIITFFMDILTVLKSLYDFYC